MMLGLARRFVTEVDPRLLGKFAWNFGFGGLRAVQQFKKRLRAGVHFPAFVFISITDRCNLRCRGCWVRSDGQSRDLSPAEVGNIIEACKARGGRFFGILGGEPTLHLQLIEMLATHRDCYFQLFTNGMALSGELAAELRRLGNVTPVISVEGLDAESQRRRGQGDVFAKAMEALDHCRRNRLVTGVASSICRSNIDELASEQFVRAMIACGVHYLWYYFYRPSGPDPAPELALTSDELVRLRSFIADIRGRLPIVVVDSYWDDAGRALCPAAVGISHHVGPGGDIEPCPPVQLAVENIRDGRGLFDAVASSRFLESFRKLAAETTRGCILLERPDLLAELAVKYAARDTSGRGAVLAELAAMKPRSSHDLPGREIPERHWAYRFAKKHWFFGFGAYA